MDNILSTVHCCIVPPGIVRLLEAKGRHYLKFTIFDFSSPIIHLPAIHQYCIWHRGLEDSFEVYSSRSDVFY